MTVSKKLYRERKEQNLCTKCGKSAELNKTLCLYHLNKSNKNQKAMFDRRKKTGLCPKCGKLLTNNRKTCNECLDKGCPKQREDVWISWTNRAKRGLCVACGELNSTSNKWCSKCSKKYRSKEYSTRKSRILRGVCGACGKGLLSKNRKRCIICIQNRKRWWASSDCKIKRIEQNKILKCEIVHHYGSKCSCCGETEKTFLAIDHINGGGNSHRRHINKYSGRNYYQWIIEQDFPDYLQILCHNCNMSKHLCGGMCAHKLATTGV